MQATGRAPAVQVSKSASELKHAMIAARRQTEPLRGVAQQGQTRCVRFRDLLDEARRRTGVADDAVEAELAALADGSLAPERRAELDARIAASPELASAPAGVTPNAPSASAAMMTLLELPSIPKQAYLAD